MRAMELQVWTLRLLHPPRSRHIQRSHRLEGSPDPSPFPVEDEIPVNDVVDTDDRTAFPSLAPSVCVIRPANPAAWVADPDPRIKAVGRYQPVISDSFTLSAIELAGNKDGKPTLLGEIMKQVMSKFKVRVEASTNGRTRQTTFHMKSASQKELDKAKQSLLDLLSGVTRGSASNAPERENNLNNRPWEVNLHGLYVNEAVSYVDESIQVARQIGDTEIRLIVGKGPHSSGRVAKTKPAIEALLMKHNIPARVDPHNVGVLIAQLS